MMINNIVNKLSIEECNAFLTLTKVGYEAGLIKEESRSQLLMFTIRQILNQVDNDQKYYYLEQEQQQKKAQNNQQQQLHKQFNLVQQVSSYFKNRMYRL